MNKNAFFVGMIGYYLLTFPVMILSIPPRGSGIGKEMLLIRHGVIFLLLVLLTLFFRRRLNPSWLAGVWTMWGFWVGLVGLAFVGQFFR
ncbi:MAG: hypothetical protein HQL56_15545 [Magnetococcales bacterium]|nr:hypothetical protein [Magnetococcales bacterium]